MINIILLILAVVNTVWAYQRTKYAKDSLTLQRLDFEAKRKSQAPVEIFLDSDDDELGAMPDEEE